ncbi:MAG: two-component regulator propeller domain-containing protein [Phocaeicola sp.]
MIKKITVASFLVFLTLYLNATEYLFKNIEIKDGLSSHQINNIFKDSEGFMWFSTSAGLNRYDGIEFRHFKSNNFEKDPFADNNILNIQQDYWESLWIKTALGYTIYDPETETYKKDIRGWMQNHGIEGVPTQVLIDSKKHMWFNIPPSAGNLLIPEKKLLYNLSYNNSSTSTSQIVNMVECRDGVLLLFDNGTVICFSKEDASQEWELNNIAIETNGSKHIDFNAMEDLDGDLWFYSSEGLWVYNPAQKRWKTELINPLRNQSTKNVKAITQDAQKNIWIGRSDSGIQILNKKDLSVTEVAEDPSNKRSLQSNNIRSLYTDEHGTVWVGTGTKGISYYNESSFKFGFDELGDINYVKENKDGSIWLGMNNSGLFKWDRTKKLLEPISDSRQLLKNTSITALFQSKNGEIWIGTKSEGLICYNKGDYTYYQNIPSNSNSLVENNVGAIIEDNEGTIWIGTIGGGLQSLNRGTKQFTTYNVSNAKIASNRVYSLCLSNNSILMIGTEKGISKMNLADRKVNNWFGTEAGKSSLANLRVTQLYEDSRGLIWVGTYDGLSIYQPQKDDLQKISLGANQESQTISAITEDFNKNIWVTTLTEVAMVIPTRYENDKYEYQTFLYGEKDGLQQGKLNPRSIELLKSGEILYGGSYGINSIDPLNITYDKIYPSVKFTHLFISNKEIGIGEAYGNKIILEKSLNRQKTISLTPQNQIIEIRFATDDFVAPKDVSYSYKLDGFSDEWLTTKIGKVIYTNLAPGKYVLRVKATNTDGFTTGQEFTLSINIATSTAEWIRKYLVYILLVISIAIAGYFLYLYREIKKKEPNKGDQNRRTRASLYNKEYAEEDALYKDLKDDERDEEPQIIIDHSSSNHNINPAIFTIDNIMGQDLHEELEEELEVKKNPVQSVEQNNVIQVLETILLDEEGKESLEIIQTATASHVGYEGGEQFKDIEDKIETEAASEIMNSDLLKERASTPTLLVVDDNEDILDFIELNLQKTYHIKRAMNGREAWEIMKTLTPDLIICDLEMPIMAGDELCQLMKRKEKLAKIPFLLLTSKQINKKESIYKIIDHILIKPFDINSLTTLIQNMLEKKMEEFSKEKEDKYEGLIIKTDEKLIEEAIKYIKKNISKNELTIDELSKALGIDRVSLYKKIVAATGKKPIEFIRIIRLKHAKRLLTEGRYKITEIVSQVGFNSVKSFDKFFEKEFGMTPEEYIENKKQKTN